jgi:hypothetical protein
MNESTVDLRRPKWPAFVAGLMVLLCSSAVTVHGAEPNVWKARQCVKWQAKVGFVSGPISLTRPRIIVGTVELDKADRSSGVLLCFDRESGKLIWRIKHPRLELHGYDRPQNGIQSRAYVDGGRLFYVSNRGQLMCLDLAGFRDGINDGPIKSEKQVSRLAADVVWKLDMVRSLGVAKMDDYDGWNPVSSPLVLGDLVYTVTGNGCRFFIGARPNNFVPKPRAPSFIAVNKGSGKLAWSHTVPAADLASCGKLVSVV